MAAQTAPLPQQNDPSQGQFTDPRINWMLHQAGSGAHTIQAYVDHLWANTAGLLDEAANKISDVTGQPKGGLFENIANWAKDRQQMHEQQAAEMRGSDQSLPGAIVRTGTSALLGLPIYAGAGALGSAWKGYAILGALENADQGWKSELMGASEGALMGKFYQTIDALGRPIKIPLAAVANYFGLRAQGADPETAASNALTAGAMVGLTPGTKTVGEVAQDLRPGFVPKRPGVQQAAVDYLEQEGVPLTAGQKTGSKFLRGTEQSVGHMPIGAQYAEEFGTRQSEAIKDLSSRLAEQAYPTPVSKYEAGQEASLALNKEISDLNDQENAAYDRAWQDKDNPQFAKDVQVGTERKPMLDANGKPTGTMQNVPITESVQMPVDVRWVKQIARQELPKLETLPAATQAQRAAVSIFRSALNGPDHITAEMGEEWLKGFKGELRTPKGKTVNPDLLDYSQGQSARIIPRLQQAVDAAVAETGQEAVEGLRNGRALHAQKMDIADVADDLRKEPVQAFGQMTMAKDAGVDYLKKIASKAPDIMPRLGRAWLDNLFDLASREGDWRKAQTILNAWNDLGPQTKALMFPESSFRQSLERFFLGQKITSIPLNPSGTALVTATQKAMTNPLGWVQGWLGGKALYTPRGIQLLLKSAENPPTTPAAAAALKSEARKTLGPPEEPPEGPPTGGGPSPPNPPQPPAGSAAASQSTPPAQAFIQRLKDFLADEEGASPSRRGTPMSLQELMGQPEKVFGGQEAPRTLKLKPTGKGGSLLTSDLGQALENSVAKRFKLGRDASPERRLARAIESMTSDLRYAIAEDDGGSGWYTDDVKEMERILVEHRPEFADPSKMSLFKYLLGITSNGIDPELNFDAALRGWDIYQRDGRFSAYDTSRKSEYSTSGDTGLTFRANSYASAMERLNQLVDDMGGEAGAVEWLKTKHPVEELRQRYPKMKGANIDENGEAYGAYMLGPKVGAFGSNLNGIHTELTADKWWSRTWNRWMGTLMDTDKNGNVNFDDKGNPLVQDDPRNDGERNLMREAAASVAEDLGLNVSELQAVLWYAEQRLYRFYGIDASSVSYADAARNKFGDVRPPENAIDRGAAKGGGPPADNGKIGLRPAKAP